MASYSEFLARLRAEWTANLQPVGVAWPIQSQEPALVRLFMDMPNGVSQNELTRFYNEQGIPGGYNKQARHLAATGWAISTGNRRGSRMRVNPRLRFDELALDTVAQPNGVWASSNRIARLGSLGVADWSERLLQFSKRGCAVCGISAKHYDKGHLDPTKPPTPSNIVPMCVECNNWGQAHNVAFSLGANLVARPIIATKNESKKNAA